MVGIRDVARQAHVSAQTVSNVINSPEIVKESTRVKVQKVIEELGYFPNVSARNLRIKRSSTIGIGVSEYRYSPIFDLFLHALAKHADTYDLRILLYNVDSPESEQSQFVKLTERGDVDAFVLTDTNNIVPRFEWLKSRNKNFVLFGRPWGVPEELSRQIDWVDVDSYTPVYKLTQQLILRGKKTIGFIGWDEDSGVGRDRLRGWRSAMSEAKMCPPEELETLSIFCDDDITSAETACRMLVGRHPDIDALVCASDTLATGVILNLGTDTTVCVTGFDDTAESQSLRFTSVKQPIDLAAKEIVQILLKKTSEDISVSERTQVLLKPEIIVR